MYALVYFSMTVYENILSWDKNGNKMSNTLVSVRKKKSTILVIFKKGK